MHTVKLIIEALVFGCAIFWSVAMIAKFIEFYVKGMNKMSAKIESPFYMRVALLWAIFYLMKVL